MSGAFNGILQPLTKQKTIKNGSKEHISDFIETDDWPISSPNLNPLDNKLWLVQEEHACRHQNLDSLEAAIKAGR